MDYLRVTGSDLQDAFKADPPPSTPPPPPAAPEPDQQLGPEDADFDILDDMEQSTKEQEQDRSGREQRMKREAQAADPGGGLEALGSMLLDTVGPGVAGAEEMVELLIADEDGELIKHIMENEDELAMEEKEHVDDAAQLGDEGEGGEAGQEVEGLMEEKEEEKEEEVEEEVDSGDFDINEPDVDAEVAKARFMTTMSIHDAGNWRFYLNSNPRERAGVMHNISGNLKATCSRHPRCVCYLRVPPGKVLEAELDLIGWLDKAARSNIVEHADMSLALRRDKYGTRVGG